MATSEDLDSPISELSLVTEGIYSSYEASLLTPLTSPYASPKPEPCTQEGDGLFSSPFLPASLDDPTRNGPNLPKALPQLLENATPLEVAEAVYMTLIYQHDKRTHDVSSRIVKHRITGLKEYVATISRERTLTNLSFRIPILFG